MFFNDPFEGIERINDTFRTLYSKSEHSFKECVEKKSFWENLAIRTFSNIITQFTWLKEKNIY